VERFKNRCDMTGFEHFDNSMSKSLGCTEDDILETLVDFSKAS